MDDATKDAQPQEQVMLQISITAEGQVKVVGPALADRTASYGLLEVAKDAVRELHTPKQILRPQGNFLDTLRGVKTR